MEVILQQNFPALGYVGDTVKVKGGYARNYLIPRGIALEALTRNAKLLKHRLGGVNAKKVKLRGQAQELSTQLEALTLEFTLKVGGSGKSFGSVTARDIEQAMREKGFALDKRQIILPEPVRKAGEHTVFIKLHAEVQAAVKVHVTSEASEQKPKAAAAEGEEAGEEKAKAARKPRTRKAKAKTEEQSEGAAEPAASGTEPAPAPEGKQE